MMEKEIVIIGGGPAGYTLASRLAKCGREVLLIEKGKMGGTCLNVGCIPTKAFLQRNDDQSWQEALEKQRVIIEASRQNMEAELLGMEIEIRYGTASFASEETLSIQEEAGTRIVKFGSCIVATGSRSRLVPQAVVRGNICTSTEFLNLNQCPEELVIIGGGIIGIEAAEICSLYGGKTTILERDENILTGWDEDIVNIYMRTLKEKNIEIYTDCHIEEIEDEGEQCTCIFRRGNIYDEKVCDKVLISVGREPEIESLNLAAAQIDHNVSGIEVDDNFMTSNKRVFAIGDCISGGEKFAHIAEYQAYILAGILCDKQYVQAEGTPMCCYSNPQMMQIFRRGNREQPNLTRKKMYRANPIASIHGERNCMIKMSANRNSHEITAIAAIGEGVSELSGEAAIIINNKMRLENIAYSIHMHPTINEEIHQLAREMLAELENEDYN